MIGCLLGTLGALAIVRWYHRRRYGWGRYGGGGYGLGAYGSGAYGSGMCGHGGYGRHHRGGWDDDFGGGPRFDRHDRGVHLFGALDHLELSPAQERAVRAAFDELRAAARAQRGEWSQTRKDVAQAFRKDSFDEVMMGELYARHDTALESLRKAFVGAGARVHEALDEKQRARLADLIESAPRSLFGRWPGRGYARPAWSW